VLSVREPEHCILDVVGIRCIYAGGVSTGHCALFTGGEDDHFPAIVYPAWPIGKRNPKIPRMGPVCLRTPAFAATLMLKALSPPYHAVQVQDIETTSAW